MGTYLANGIAIRITITGEIKNKKEEILNQLKNFIDIDSYTIYEESHYIILDIDREFFNENIHNCLKEISSMLGTDFFEFYNNKDNSISNQIIFDKTFNKKNYPIKLEKYQTLNNKSKLLEKFYIKMNPCNLIHNQVKHYSPFNGNYWITLGNNNLENVRIKITLVANWIDFVKYYGEDPTWNLYILNTMKMTYYKNPLSKNLIYFILGI